MQPRSGLYRRGARDLKHEQMLWTRDEYRQVAEAALPLITPRSNAADLVPVFYKAQMTLPPERRLTAQGLHRVSPWLIQALAELKASR